MAWTAGDSDEEEQGLCDDGAASTSRGRSGGPPRAADAKLTAEGPTRGRFEIRRSAPQCLLLAVAVGGAFMLGHHSPSWVALAVLGPDAASARSRYELRDARAAALSAAGTQSTAVASAAGAAVEGPAAAAPAQEAPVSAPAAGAQEASAAGAAVEGQAAPAAGAQGAPAPALTAAPGALGGAPMATAAAAAAASTQKDTTTTQRASANAAEGPLLPLRLVVTSYVRYTIALVELLKSLESLGFSRCLKEMLVVVGGSSSEVGPHPMEDERWGRLGVTVVNTTLNAQDLTGLSALYHHRGHPQVAARAYLYVHDTVLFAPDFVSRFSTLASLIGEDELRIPPMPASNIFAFGRRVVERYQTHFDVNLSKQAGLDVEWERRGW